MKMKNGFIVSEVIFLGFLSRLSEEQPEVPVLYRDVSSLLLIQILTMPQPLHKGMLQKYVYLDDCVYEAAFMVISRMVNHSWSTVYSKIMFLPYLQKVALNRSFCCRLTGLSVSPVFSPYQSAYSVKIEELSETTKYFY